MQFELLATIDRMIDLYQKPRTFERFQEYLKNLEEDTKGDLAFPITGYNPMAKEHVLDRLHELKDLGAEQIITETLDNLNESAFTKHAEGNFNVALNVLDDLKGGWTNRYTSDFDSKFKINALVKRNFCVPVLWVSEKFTEELIRDRVTEYVLRTVHRLTHPNPETLQEHFAQEVFATSLTKKMVEVPEADFTAINKFYLDNQNKEDYHIIFNFFYGDTACATLEFPTFGVVDNFTGYDLARVRLKIGWS